MKYKIVATPAHNVYIGHCIMIAAARGTNEEVFLLVKTKEDPLTICKRDGQILFDQNDFGKISEVPLRISDACITGIFGDMACSCHVDSMGYLEMIRKSGVGVFLYLPHEGMGRGLIAKISDHRLQLGLGIGGQNMRPMSFEESAEILFGDSSYDSRTYKDIGILFGQLGLNVFTFLYFGENMRKLKAIQAETNLQLNMYSEDAHE